MKSLVCITLTYFPPEIIKHITAKCWFVSSFDDSWAFALKGSELKEDEHMIFLSDELLDEPVGQIRWTIAHEIGHVILEHKNAILEKQSKSEVKKQEKQADRFAYFYLHQNH